MAPVRVAGEGMETRGNRGHRDRWAGAVRVRDLGLGK